MTVKSTLGGYATTTLTTANVNRSTDYTSHVLTSIKDKGRVHIVCPLLRRELRQHHARRLYFHAFFVEFQEIAISLANNGSGSPHLD